MSYISHARTPEELKEEVISDIRRRLQALDDYDKYISRSEAQKLRIATAKMELEAMLLYYINLSIVRPIRKRNKT